MNRPNYFQLKNGSKAKLPFTDHEYESRLKGLREIISKNNLSKSNIRKIYAILFFEIKKIPS